MNVRPFLILTIAATVLLPACNACRERYFSTLEKVGIEKRELLVDRVESARDAQEDAQEQFRDALEEFQSVVGYEGGELEQVYEKLDREYQRSANKAEKVRNRIRKVRNVAESLFREWEDELGQYQSSSFRDQSERDLRDTRNRYEDLVEVMERAADKMDPVVAKLNDQVLFLKHNLNARALGSLEDTASELQTDVAALIAEMEASIREADRFIEEMGAAG